MKQYDDGEAAERGKSRYGNSLTFDKAAYEADGGDGMFDPHAIELLKNPGKVDEGLWEKAKRASQEAFGEIKWPFVTYWYKRHGGKFS